MFLERLIEAINDLFAKFWIIVMILLPFVLNTSRLENDQSIYLEVDF